MWPRTLHLANDKRWFAVIVGAGLTHALLAAIALASVLADASRNGPRRTFHVSFEVLGEEHELAAGSLPYDAYAVHRINVTDPNLTVLECRIEWRDEGRTPLQYRYVNLFVDSQVDRNLSTVDEIAAPGGVLIVAVPNAIPANATVAARTEGEAISMAASNANNTTAGTGEWWIRVTTQAPSDVRPFTGGQIYYRIWVTLRYNEGVAAIFQGG